MLLITTPVMRAFQNVPTSFVIRGRGTKFMAPVENEINVVKGFSVCSPDPNVIGAKNYLSINFYWRMDKVFHTRWP